MKKFTFLLLLGFPFLLLAQKPERKVENKSDTVVTHDAMNKEREHWVIHNMKGDVSSQGFMLHGKRDGVWREYNEGNAALIKVAEYKEGVLNGATVIVSTSGSVQTEETYFNGKKNGPRITYSYFGGRLKMTENYKDDVLNGTAGANDYSGAV